jgi:hypothetical protein
MCDKKLEFISISFESEKKARDSLESVLSFLKKLEVLIVENFQKKAMRREFLHDGSTSTLKVWGYEELTRTQLSGLQQKPTTRIARSKSQVSGSLLLVVV